MSKLLTVANQKMRCGFAVKAELRFLLAVLMICFAAPSFAANATLNSSSQTLCATQLRNAATPISDTTISPDVLNDLAQFLVNYESAPADEASTEVLKSLMIEKLNNLKQLIQNEEGMSYLREMGLSYEEFELRLEARARELLSPYLHRLRGIKGPDHLAIENNARLSEGEDFYSIALAEVDRLEKIVKPVVTKLEKIHERQLRNDEKIEKLERDIKAEKQAHPLGSVDYSSPLYRLRMKIKEILKIKEKPDPLDQWQDELVEALQSKQRLYVLYSDTFKILDGPQGELDAAKKILEMRRLALPVQNAN